MGDEEFKNRREYSRVPAECPMIYRVIDPSEGERSQGNPLYRIPSIPSLDIGERIYNQQERPDQVLELLLWLDMKVSFLIKNLPGRKERDIFPYQGIIIDISVSGMRFSASKKFERGTHLESEFVLPMIPFKEMFLTGDVVRCVEVKRNDKRSPAHKPSEEAEHRRSPVPQDSNEAEPRTPSEYEVSVAFKGMKESEREQIIRYAVKRQMQLQREKQDRG